ncbi:MAG: HEAT repeat domain-containing protein [Candidatus Omnitrophica bacterium]|nr:HEAT repeat domain-containing protein [Candidatus Omnitrophota bacterium]
MKILNILSIESKIIAVILVLAIISCGAKPRELKAKDYKTEELMEQLYSDIPSIQAWTALIITEEKWTDDPGIKKEILLRWALEPQDFVTSSGYLVVPLDYFVRGDYPPHIIPIEDIGKTILFNAIKGLGNKNPKYRMRMFNLLKLLMDEKLGTDENFWRESNRDTYLKEAQKWSEWWDANSGYLKYENGVFKVDLDAKKSGKPIDNSKAEDFTSKISFRPINPIWTKYKDLTVKTLIDILQQEKEWRIRAKAASLLGNIGATESIDQLLATMKGDSEWFVRITAMDALGKLKAEKAIPEFKSRLLELKFLDELKTDYKEIAASALGRIGTPEAFDILISALDEDTPVEQYIISALGQTKSKKALECLERKIAENKLGESSKSVAIVALANLSPEVYFDKTKLDTAFNGNFRGGLKYCVLLGVRSGYLDWLFNPKSSELLDYRDYFEISQSFKDAPPYRYNKLIPDEEKDKELNDLITWLYENKIYFHWDKKNSCFIIDEEAKKAGIPTEEYRKTHPWPETSKDPSINSGQDK